MFLAMFGATPNDLERSLAIAALTAIAVTHFADLPDKVADAPYMAALFVMNIAASLALAALLIARRMQRAAIQAGGALSLLTLVGFVLSRSIGLPQIEDHVGHWLDPAGIAAALAEITMVGLALPFVAAEPDRLAFFVAVPMTAFLALSVAAGQSFGGQTSDHAQPSEGGATVAASHVHARAPAQPGADNATAHAHLHAEGTIHTHARGVIREFSDLAAASAADRDKARTLLRRVQRSAQTLFPNYSAALEAGFRHYLDRRWHRPLAFHVRRLDYARDHRVLDPKHPESLVYWWPRRGRPVLLAMMFRLLPGAPPDAAGSIPIWHLHGDEVAAMAHVWLTQDLRTAFANCLPGDALNEANPEFRYEPPRSFQAHSTLLCRTEP